ncbi:anti-sigma factor [Nesterenkonia marinintestina]|uniref:anti-sigma factor n=1 Tax=Nesterenkonia marinintestina TaxID=2979865 RepID=UPI0021C0CBB9|nr:anti-sigma factor [Nesterenkonia sp. GX14115]
MHEEPDQAGRPDYEYLAAGWVLGGLSASEQELADRLEAEDPAFRTEVAAFEDTLGLLGGTDEPVEPSPETEAAILSIPGRLPQQSETGQSETGGGRAPEPAARPPRDRGRMLFALAASVLFVVAAVLGGVAVVQHQERSQLEEELTLAQQEQRDAERLLGAPDLTSAHEESGDGGSVTVSYSVDEQLIRVTPHDIPSPDEGQELQMWIIDEEGAHDAGMMAADSSSVVSGPDFSQGSAFGVTVEPAGGSVEPTSDPILVAEL